MIVKKYYSKVLSITDNKSNVYTIILKSMGFSYKYLPGQFLHLALDEEYDGVGQWPDSRCFSIQSNPNDKYLKITYSVKGRFTNQMKEELKPGRKVWLKLPYGNLFQQTHNIKNALFIAGGTGITPFLSLFTHDSFSLYSNPVLYAGFRNITMNIYREELEISKLINPSIKIITKYENIDGKLDIDEIFKTSKRESSFFISGPKDMVTIFKNKLLKHNVMPKNIFVDEWE